MRLEFACRGIAIALPSIQEAALFHSTTRTTSDTRLFIIRLEGSQPKLNEAFMTDLGTFPKMVVGPQEVLILDIRASYSFHLIDCDIFAAWESRKDRQRGCNLGAKMSIFVKCRNQQNITQNHVRETAKSVLPQQH